MALNTTEHDKLTAKNILYLLKLLYWLKFEIIRMKKVRGYSLFV